MSKKERIKFKKEIRKILKESEWKSDWSTHSELADFILDEFEDYENSNL